MTALLLTGVLGALALLHLAWAVGFWWPIRDEAALARATVGTRDVTKMPGPLPCALVAVALGFVASLPHTPGFPGQRLWMAAAALIFAARGLAAYAPVWRRMVPQQPFATLDRQIYGPLCLALGAGMAALVLTGD